MQKHVVQWLYCDPSTVECSYIRCTSLYIRRTVKCVNCDRSRAYSLYDNCRCKSVRVSSLDMSQSSLHPGALAYTHDNCAKEMPIFEQRKATMATHCMAMLYTRPVHVNHEEQRPVRKTTRLPRGIAYAKTIAAFYHR